MSLLPIRSFLNFKQLPPANPAGSIPFDRTCGPPAVEQALFPLYRILSKRKGAESFLQILRPAVHIGPAARMSCASAAPARGEGCPDGAQYAGGASLPGSRRMAMSRTGKEHGSHRSRVGGFIEVAQAGAVSRPCPFGTGTVSPGNSSNVTKAFPCKRREHRLISIEISRGLGRKKLNLKHPPGL